MVDSLAILMVAKGISSLLFKRDLKRYYRQIFVDPADIPKLGYRFDNRLYFNATLPMGMTSSCYIAQRVSSAISYLMEKRGYSCVNYIDDLGGVDTPSKANEAFEHLGALLWEIGILESTAKASPPSHIMTFLGIQLNLITQTLSIDSEKLSNIREITSWWLNKTTASLKDIQKLVGSVKLCDVLCTRRKTVFLKAVKFVKRMS